MLVAVYEDGEYGMELALGSYNVKENDHDMQIYI